MASVEASAPGVCLHWNRAPAPAAYVWLVRLWLLCVICWACHDARDVRRDPLASPPHPASASLAFTFSDHFSQQGFFSDLS